MHGGQKLGGVRECGCEYLMKVDLLAVGEGECVDEDGGDMEGKEGRLW